MKIIRYCLFLSCIELTGYASGFENSCLQHGLNDVAFIQKNVNKRHHRGRRGHRGSRGNRGPDGENGRPGVSISSVMDRAYFMSPNSEYPDRFVLKPGDLPMVVPVDHTDLGSFFFEQVTNSFIVPESGLYQITYFMKAARLEQFQPSSGLNDAGGLVMGILIDANLSTPIGLKSLPLASSNASCTGAFDETHQIFVRLNKDQRIQIAILADPSKGQAANATYALQFVQKSTLVEEVAYLAIKKITD
jgi:hypothetical protein